METYQQNFYICSWVIASSFTTSKSYAILSCKRKRNMLSNSCFSYETSLQLRKCHNNVKMRFFCLWHQLWELSGRWHSSKLSRWSPASWWSHGIYHFSFSDPYVDLWKPNQQVATPTSFSQFPSLCGGSKQIPLFLLSTS